MADKEYVMLLSSNSKNGKLVKEFLERKFKKTSLEVILNSTVEEGLYTLVQNEEKIIYAILDLTNLDKKIWNLCEELRKKNIEFILLSSIDINDKNSVIKKSGANELFIKPLKKRQLMIAIEDLAKNR